MEKYLKYIFFFLAITGFFTIRAQDVSTQVPKVSQTINIDLSSTPVGDPKHPQEYTGSVPADAINPSKPPAIPADSKIGAIAPFSQENAGSTNPKPPADIQKDPKLQADGTLSKEKELIPFIQIDNKVSATRQKGSSEQPAGLSAKETINYRNIHGPATQPEPPANGKVISYRDIKGSKDQPKGTEPKK